MKKRYLGIDYGTVRVGLALSDPTGILASGCKTVQHRGKTMEEVAFEIDRIIREQGVEEIVLGLPRRTDGKIGEKEEQVKLFADILREQTGLHITFIDEKFTTRIAHHYMNEAGVKKTKKREIVDQIAAEILLQDYLNKINS